LTDEKLAKARALALKHKNQKSGKIILALLDEIEVLKLEKHRPNDPFTDNSPCPYHPHRGKRLATVPLSFLREWHGSQNREGLKIDAEFLPFPKKAWAQRDLRFYDYCAAKIS